MTLNNQLTYLRGGEGVDRRFPVAFVHVRGEEGHVGVVHKLSHHLTGRVHIADSLEYE